MVTQPEQVNRLMLVVGEDPARIESVALAVRATSPDADVLVFDTTTHGAVPALMAVSNAGSEPGTTVMIIRASPASWTTAAILAALRPPHHRSHVDAILIAEGPPERLPVLITDFHGLRLLPPHSGTPKPSGTGVPPQHCHADPRSRGEGRRGRP
jgi:hypothetical protein